MAEEITPEEVEKYRKIFFKKLGLKESDKDKFKDLVPFLMLDGTRTSSPFKGKDAYKDGAEFAMRFCRIAKILGVKTVYINVTESFHQDRENWKDIFQALVEEIPRWKKFAEEEDIKIGFVGDIDGLPMFKEELKKNGLI